LATAAQAEPSQYLCSIERAAGVAYNKQTKKWETRVDSTGQYVLRKLTDDDRDKKKGHWAHLFSEHPRANWAFFDFGKDDPPLAACVEKPDEPRFECATVMFGASFDKDSRRFEMTSPIGSYLDQAHWEQFRRERPDDFKDYWPQGKPNPVDDPDGAFVAIGKCSPS